MTDLVPFRKLPYGAKFRYMNTRTVWVRVQHNVVAEWPHKLCQADGTPIQSLCCFCHPDSDVDLPDGLDTLVLVEPDYE